jgi:hypothetical protein
MEGDERTQDKGGRNKEGKKGSRSAKFLLADGLSLGLDYDSDAKG